MLVSLLNNKVIMTRVLVIDDCEELAEVVQELLEGEGYGVELAFNSREALEKLASARNGNIGFDVVLCDLVLPLDEETARESVNHEGDSAMVGAHCINQITAQYPGIPVIAISGELVGSPLSIVEKFGACKALSKPFGRARL